MICQYCNRDEIPTKWLAIESGDQLCHDCARREIMALLQDCTETEIDKLKDRSIDCLLEDRYEQMELFSRLIMQKKIIYEDLL